jgi:hypothetical protein
VAAAACHAALLWRVPTQVRRPCDDTPAEGAVRLSDTTQNVGNTKTVGASPYALLGRRKKAKQAADDPQFPNQNKPWNQKTLNAGMFPVGAGRSTTLPAQIQDRVRGWFEHTYSALRRLTSAIGVILMSFRKYYILTCRLHRLQ